MEGCSQRLTRAWRSWGPSTSTCVFPPSHRPLHSTNTVVSAAFPHALASGASFSLPSLSSGEIDETAPPPCRFFLLFCSGKHRNRRVTSSKTPSRSVRTTHPPSPKPFVLFLSSSASRLATCLDTNPERRCSGKTWRRSSTNVLERSSRSGTRTLPPLFSFESGSAAILKRVVAREMI